MSLIDFILQQRLILITLGLAAAVMALALLLLFGLRLRQLVMKRMARRAARRNEADDVTIADEDDDDLIAMPVVTATARTTAPQAAKPAPAAPVVGATAVTPAATAEPEVSPEMLNLLSDVFVDEKTLERHRLLLQGTSDIDIQDLALLARSVADRLNGKAPAEIQRVSGQ